MAIIGSLFALAGRFAGRAVNALIGWATVLLFGRVEARKQTILGLVAIGSLAWVATLVGIAVPDVGTVLVAAVPRPDFVAEDHVRVGMVFAALLIPLAIGVAGVWLVDERSRPRGWGLLTAILRGYPFTALLAFMMAFLASVAFVRKMHSLRRRWSDAHVALIVKPGAYDRVVADLVDVLRRAGLEVRARAAPEVLSLPPRLLDRVAGHALGGMVPDRLVLIVAPGLEILVYPSDLAFSGEREVLARARAAVLSRLTRAPAWLTMSREAQEIEDAIAAIGRQALGDVASVTTATFASIDERLATVVLPFDDWESLYRMRLQVEREARLGRELLLGRDRAPTAALPAAPSEPARRTPRSAVMTPRREAIVGLVGGLGLVALVIADILLLLRGGDRSGRPAGSRALVVASRGIRMSGGSGLRRDDDG